MNLLKVLIISWATGFSLSYFKDANIEYQAKCLLMSVSFYIMAVFCYLYLMKQLKLKLRNRTDVYLISALCCCMVVSSWFNLLFANPDIYYLLINIKQGNGLSWKLIYSSVEIIALLTVGKNGIIYIYNWFICRRRWLNAIITYNTAYNIGR